MSPSSLPLTLSKGALDSFLPGTIGEWDGEIYSVGLWDAAKAIYARQSVLESNGIRIPTNEVKKQYDGKQEWFSITIGGTRYSILASDAVFMKSLVNVFFIVCIS
jgi:hypothetical protein